MINFPPFQALPEYLGTDDGPAEENGKEDEEEGYVIEMKDTDGQVRTIEVDGQVMVIEGQATKGK